MLAAKYWFLVLYLLFSICTPLFPCSSPSVLASLLPSGGRGSYNDMGGPVITTQVTIPKDVSEWEVTPKEDQSVSLTVQSRHNIQS